MFVSGKPFKPSVLLYSSLMGRLIMIVNVRKAYRGQTIWLVMLIGKLQRKLIVVFMVTGK